MKFKIIYENKIIKKYTLKLYIFFKNKKKIYFVFFLLFLFYEIKRKNKINNQLFDQIAIIDNIKINYSEYENTEFAIIKRMQCRECGLFSDYIVFLGCIYSFLRKGIVPIIDLQSYENIFNGFNINESNKNPWEYFFSQPFGYTLNQIKKRTKKFKYFECQPNIFRPNDNIYLNKILINFWHKIANIYIPIKKKIIIEAKIIIKKLFKDSNNILGILIRGTDYISRKPKDHPIPPTPSMVIKDIKKINIKNNYDWFFISTEDDIIRDKFIKEFDYKLKFLFYKKINYNFTNKQFLSSIDNVKGKIKFIKIYLLNMIILSKCIDILTANTSGAIGVFILSNGFRYIKVYNLGYYK